MEVEEMFEHLLHRPVALGFLVKLKLLWLESFRLILLLTARESVSKVIAVKRRLFFARDVNSFS